jgi:hypothetical protein
VKASPPSTVFISSRLSPPQPSDYQEQKEYFSGKQKQHTFKNQFITLPQGKDIVDVEVGKKEPTSDISWFRDNNKSLILLSEKLPKELHLTGISNQIGAELFATDTYI